MPSSLKACLAGGFSMEMESAAGWESGRVPLSQTSPGWPSSPARMWV